LQNIIERILIFLVGAIFVVGSVKFIFGSMEAQRAAIPAIGYGILGFVIGLILCVWAFAGPPG
jgi:hypothetical protein